MRIGGLEISWQTKNTLTLDQFIERMEAVALTAAGESITPENCMRSPTVHAIVTGISRRLSSLPLRVMRKTMVNGKEAKEKLPDHPVQFVLDRPNRWQTQPEYVMDMASVLVRYGQFFAMKGQGRTGAVRFLEPIANSAVTVEQNDDMSLLYRVTKVGGAQIELNRFDMHHIRGPARDFINGNSPIMDVKDAIGLEIASERFGGSYFGNGAQPGLVFEFLEGFAGFKTPQERAKFLEDFRAAYSGRNRFAAMVLPKGMKVGTVMGAENEKSQYIETRKLQRSIIAGALGVPPHLVGDLERGTFSNIEHQSLEFYKAVILPFARNIELALERDLLTADERKLGVIIRFNLEAFLRGDFPSRQAGLNIQRQAGVISANEWRELEGMNPRTDEGGDAYYEQGPSGQTPSTGSDDSSSSDDSNPEDGGQSEDSETPSA